MTHATNTAIDGGRFYSIRRRLIAGLIGYAILLTLGVLANDFVVNESAEQLAWESLLQAELTHFLNRRAQDPNYSWPETETLQLLAIDRLQDSREPLLKLAPGVHDEVIIDGRQKVILIEDVGDQRFVIALDISDLEGREARLRLVILASAFVVVVLLGCIAAWGASRLIQPLQELADHIGALNPANSDQSIALPANASTELVLITQSINRYIERNKTFMEREQTFIRVASHELRTPISIIAGAAQLALDEPEIPPAVYKRLLRIAETANDTNELVTLLLTLAKDPERLADSREQVRLHELLPQLVRDHHHLARAKSVAVVIGELPESGLLAPLQMVKAAIGNLLRNAIENTHHGDVRISLREPGIVVIEDHGPGLPAEKISEIYTRLVRGDGLHGGGIGLALIMRLCEHLDWSLAVESPSGKGTRVALNFLPGADAG